MGSWLQAQALIRIFECKRTLEIALHLLGPSYIDHHAHQYLSARLHFHDQRRHDERQWRCRRHRQFRHGGSCSSLTTCKHS